VGLLFSISLFLKWYLIKNKRQRLKSLDKFLKDFNFSRHPFAGVYADDEKNLYGYFIQPANFDNIKGKPESTVPFFYFASRGKGKSAMVRMINYLLTEASGKGEPILVVNFRRRDFDKVLKKAEGDPTLVKRDDYRQVIFELVLQALQKQSSRLEELLSPVSIVDSPEIRNLDQLENLCQYLDEVGVRAIYILVDGVDELEITATNPKAASILLYSFINDMDLLEVPHLAFKFFLPTEIKDIIHILRVERVIMLDGTKAWSVEDLKRLLERRLRFYSRDHSIGRLSQLSYLEDLDEMICQAASGSPRNLIRLGYFLIDAYLQEDVDKIEKSTFDRAIQEFKEALKKEEGYQSTPNQASNLKETLFEAVPKNNAEPFEQPSPLDEPKQPQNIKSTEIEIIGGNLLSIKGKDVFIGGHRLNEPPTGKEFLVLEKLYEHGGNTVTKDELIDYAYNEAASDEQLDAIIKRLRKKLGKTSHYYIKTIRDTGFILINFDKNNESI
jgi:hypothetical protein